jgi:hypothetical protein
VTEKRGDITRPTKIISGADAAGEKSGVTAPIRQQKDAGTTAPIGPVRVPRPPLVVKTGKVKVLPKVFTEEGGKKESLIEADRGDSALDKARQLRKAEVVRKKRAAAIEKLRAEEAVRDKWMRFYRLMSWVLLGGTIWYAWRVTDLAHGDQWPMMHVWLVLATGIMAVFFGAMWYINRPEL